MLKGFDNRGSWHRHNAKTEQDSLSRLTVKAFREVGVFKKYRENVPFSIGAHSFKIELATTTPHYGGARYWFRCPECERRCAVLYHRIAEIKCRTCFGLSYASQNEDNVMRGLRKASRTMQRLGGDNIFCQPERPKGMRQQTYDRLMIELAATMQKIF